MKKLSYILSSLLFLTSCDSDNSLKMKDPIEFRDLEYKAWYIDQNTSKIDLLAFAKIVLYCDQLQKPEELAVTYTRYEKEKTTSTQQVIGLGFSMWANDPLAQCYEDLIIDMGGIPF